MIKVVFKDNICLSEKEVLKFHPQIKSFLNEIKEKGWKYSIMDIEGEAVAEIDENKVKFELHYYPPDITEPDSEGRYALKAELGSEPPAVIKVLSVKAFKIKISTPHCWNAATVNPFKKTVTHIKDVLWRWSLNKEKKPSKLSEAREVYEVAKWLIEEKKFKPENSYVLEDYKQLVELFEKPYTFKLKLSLTVKDEEKVPSWDKIVEDLSEFFLERGLLMSIERNKNKLFFLEKKPLP